MFNESKLASELKSAYKHGYRIMSVDGILYIITNYFIVKIPLEDVPRKVLGVLVEHIGYIPENCAISCSKNAANQTLIKESLHAMISANDFETQIFAYSTTLNFKSTFKLFQKENNEIVCIKEDLLGLLEIDSPPMINTSNTRAVWVGKAASNGTGMYLIIGVSPSKDDIQLNYLEQFDWRIKD